MSTVQFRNNEDHQGIYNSSSVVVVMPFCSNAFLYYNWRMFYWQKKSSKTSEYVKYILIYWIIYSCRDSIKLWFRNTARDFVMKGRKWELGWTALQNTRCHPGSRASLVSQCLGQLKRLSYLGNLLIQPMSKVNCLTFNALMFFYI